VVKHLEDKGIFSAYHLYHKQVQGREADPTFYLFRHLDKPYHIDYCFVSADIAKHIISVEIGAHDYWTKLSDHVPLIVTLNNC
jgi:endonuclease/exonuclease/phosphatase family metal-dependent hydrolase